MMGVLQPGHFLDSEKADHTFLMESAKTILLPKTNLVSGFCQFELSLRFATAPMRRSAAKRTRGRARLALPIFQRTFVLHNDRVFAPRIVASMNVVRGSQQLFQQKAMILFQIARVNATSNFRRHQVIVARRTIDVLHLFFFCAFENKT